MSLLKNIVQVGSLGASLTVAEASTNTVLENSKQQLPGTLQLYINNQEQHQARVQLKNDNFNLTAFYPVQESFPKDFTLATQLNLEKLKVDLALKEKSEQKTYRAGIAYSFDKNDELRLVTTQSEDKDQYIAGATLKVTDSIVTQAAVDHELNFRTRLIYSTDTYQTSLSVGVQDENALASVSFNTRKVWLAADLGARSSKELLSNSGVRIAIGDIDKDRSMKADELEFPGRHELAILPNLTRAPESMALGQEPQILYGGRSFATFLGSKAYDKVMFADFRNQRRLATEVAVRLPSCQGINQPYFAIGQIYNFKNHTHGMSLECGIKIATLALRTRAELVQEGKAQVGAVLEKSW